MLWVYPNSAIGEFNFLIKPELNTIAQLILKHKGVEPVRLPYAYAKLSIQRACSGGLLNFEESSRTTAAEKD